MKTDFPDYEPPEKCIFKLQNIWFLIKFDSAKCHTIPKVFIVSNYSSSLKFTNLIQPVKVVWFSLLKGAFHELW